MSHETARAPLRLSNPLPMARLARSATKVTVHWMGPSFNYASPEHAKLLDAVAEIHDDTWDPVENYHGIELPSELRLDGAGRVVREKKDHERWDDVRVVVELSTGLNLAHTWKYENEFTIQHVRASDERPLFHARAVAGACSRFPGIKVGVSPALTIGELQRWWIKGPPPPTVVHVHCPPLEVVNDVGQLLTLAILREKLLEMVSDDPIVRLNSFGPRCLGPVDHAVLSALEIGPVQLLYAANNGCKSTEEAVAFLRENPDIVVKGVMETRSEGEEASLMEAEDIMASWYAPPSDKWRIFGRKDFAYFVPGFRGNTINSSW